LGYVGDITYCAVNEYASNLTCFACAGGSTNVAVDDASGSDTTCEVCAEDYYVLSGSYVACATGTTNDAGDNVTAGSNTTCDQSINDSSSGSSDDTGIIVGVVVGVVALIGIVVGVFVYMQGYSSSGVVGQGVEVTSTTA